MSLSFPPSAFVGQVYNGFTWDGVKWTATPFSTNPARIALEAALTADQTGLTAAAWNTIKYDTKVTDLQNAYNPATGIFQPTQAGVYAVSASVGQAGSANNPYGIQLLKNGTPTQGETQSLTVPLSSSGNFMQSISALIYCNGTTDTIQARAFTPTGVTTIRGGTTMVIACNLVATLLMVGPPAPASAASSGNRVLITAVDIGAAVTSVDFFNGFDGSYDELELVTFDVNPASDAAMLLRCSTDGSTFDTANNYEYAYSTTASSSGAAGAAGSAANSGAQGPTFGSNPLYPNDMVHRIRLSPVTRTTGWWSGVARNSNGASPTYGGWTYMPTTVLPIKGLRWMIAGTLNITRGSFRLFGIKK